jgi:hypothetical protein
LRVISRCNASTNGRSDLDQLLAGQPRQVALPARAVGDQGLVAKVLARGLVGRPQVADRLRYVRCGLGLLALALGQGAKRQLREHLLGLGARALGAENVVPPDLDLDLPPVLVAALDEVCLEPGLGHAQREAGQLGIPDHGGLGRKCLDSPLRQL